MALKKGTRVDRGYATVAGDDGVNYRDIAETMTIMNFPMNHSSARNYVLRVMRKFVQAFSDAWHLDLSENRIDEIAKSPQFQLGIADHLQILESRRRDHAREA